MTSALKLSTAALALTLALHAKADELQLEIIPLKHRLVEDVLPLLQALVLPGGTISGMNNQLIVRTTPANLREITQVLQQVDKASRRFKIYVRQTNALQADVQGQSLGGRYSPATDARLQYRAYATHRSDEVDSLQFVHAVEGQPALISSGQAVPMANPALIPGAFGAYLDRRVQYRDITTGFNVVVRAVADRITLQVTPHQDRLRRDDVAGSVDISSATTTVSGRLGEWLELGGVDEAYRDDSGAILHNTHQRNTQARSVAVRVEEVR